MAAAHRPARCATGVTALLQGGIDTRGCPGAVWALGDPGGQQAGGALGVLDPTDPTAPMTTDTVFDMASLTKIMAVWSSVGMLWENGQLALKDPLAELIPELHGHPLGHVTSSPTPPESRCAPTSERSTAPSLQPHTGDLQPVRGLFWMPAPDTDPADDIYVHYGFTGTGMWISPKQRRWAVLLTNKLYYNRERQPRTDIRNTVRELVFH